MAAPTELPAGTWQLDPSTSTVTVTVKKMGLLTVPATLVVTSGTVEIDDSHQVANVEIVADAASYASKNAKRNEHVLGADFLDAENHPTIGFRTSQVASESPGYTSSGTVTVKGQPSPIEITITDVDVSDAVGSFTATASVDRKTIGIDKMPTLVIGRSLQLAISAKARKNS
jgi:polyisoprenoid-binding protein YceI